MHYDRSIETYTGKQQADLSAMEVIAESTGVQIYVFESYEKDGKRMYKDEKGTEKTAPNGYYDPLTNSIHIDLYAGNNGEGVMMFTLAHELTHFIRQWSPAKFKVLADFLVQEYGKKGVSLDELVRAQMIKAQNNGRTISYDTAYEEMIADSMETMLSDGAVLRRLKKKDEALWEKIKTRINRIAKKLRYSYKGMDPQTAEGQIVSEMVDAVEKLRELFTEGLVEASENSQTSEQKAASTGKNAKASPSVESLTDNPQYSVRNYAEQVDEVKNNTHDPLNHVYMGTTPTGIVNILDLPKLPMLATPQHIYSMAVSQAQAKKESRFRSRTNYHNLGWDTVKKLPEYINNPVMIIKANTDTNDARFVVITPKADNVGNPIIVAVAPNGKGNYMNIEFPTNIMLSGYGKDGIQGFIARAKTENRILYASKKNSQKIKNTPSVQFADNILSSDYTANLSQFNQIVKDKFKGSIFENSGLPKFSNREYSIEEKTEHVKTALKHFGRTYYWKETGYLTTDGQKLDFSGRHEGGPGGYRTVDHRDIRDALGEDYGGDHYSGAMVQFMHEGNIRISPESNGINLSVMPTKAQMQMLEDYISRARGEVILDLDDANGNTVSSTEYPKGTRASKVLSDIKNYFDTGNTPQISEVSKFRYSLRDKTVLTRAELERKAPIKVVDISKPKTIKPEYNVSELADADTKFSIRNEAPPKKTGIAYKVFLAKDGGLYPPMVANPNGEATPVGVWLNADIGKMAPPSKTGRPQVQSGGKGTNVGKGSLAFRPGWHLGDIPQATQFAKLNPETGKKELFPANFVWAECEYAMDVDYQEEAMSYGYTENGKFRHSYAGLPKLPTDGYYRYRTNPNPDTVPWVITGAMRVNRILTDAETDAICRANGVEPMARQGGPINLEDFGLSEDNLLYSDRYWKPKLNKSEWSLLNRELNRQIETTDNYLDPATKWLYAKEKGTEVFAIYGIGNGTAPTPLYAVGGSKAETDYAKLQRFIRGKDHGTHENRATLNRLLTAIQNKQRKSGNRISDAGRGMAATGDVPVPEGERAGNGKGYHGAGEENSGKGIKLSDRDTNPVSTRHLLVNALESAAQTEAERIQLKKYRDNIEKMNEEDALLRDLNRQIKELSFAKGPRDKQKISELRNEAIKVGNRISIYDQRLLRMEASTPLRNVLEREKKAAYQKAKELGDKALDKYKSKASLRWRFGLNRHRLTH